MKEDTQIAVKYSRREIPVPIMRCMRSKAHVIVTSASLYAYTSGIAKKVKTMMVQAMLTQNFSLQGNKANARYAIKLQTGHFQCYNHSNPI